MCQTRNGYLQNEEKAESISFSDIPAMKKSSAAKLRWQKRKVLGGRLETGAIPVFHRWQEWLQLMRILIFFVLAK